MADVAIPKFLSGCPVLKDIQLIFSGLKHMLILDASFSLWKRLILNQIYPCVEDNMQIKVDAPSLEFIELRAMDAAVFMNVSLLSIVEVR